MKKQFLLVPLICGSLMASAQVPPLDATLKTFSEQYQQEKLHIHFDKDAYLPGETIWLKAYLMEGSKPSEHSKNIYFDWTDADGNLLLHSISPVLESASTTSFVLPLDFKGGAIHVRSYTQWMLNFDSSFLYNKNIPVLSPWDGSMPAEVKHQANIHFFPEGGDLINSLDAVIGFEVTDEFGRPCTGRGIIRNSANEFVDSFSTKHEGMGSFHLQPVAGEKYTASWKDEFGENHVSELPVAKTGGLVMRITPGPGNVINYQIERTETVPDNLKSITLVSTAQQKVIAKTTIDLQSKLLAEGTINTDQMGSGVMQVTVLDINSSPVAERVVFVNNQAFSFNTQLRTEQVNFGKKGKNEISVEIPYGFSANLSVAITDGGLSSDSTTNIITDFLISNDVRGNISNPAYYFTANSDSARIYLDLVMRTHGWRRFKWEELITGKLPAIKYAADQEFMVFEGQVTSPNVKFDNGDSVALLLINKDRKKNVLSLPINEQGMFSQRGMFFYDSVQVVYRLNHASKLGTGSEVNLKTSLIADAVNPVAATDPNFQWSKVPDVILEKELNGLLAELKNYSRQAKGLDYVITPHPKTDSLKSTSETAAHYLEGNFPGMKFQYGKMSTEDGSEDNKFASYQKPTPTPAAAPKYNVKLLLDGAPVSMDDLKQITMREVLFLKFLQKNSPKDLQTLSITSRQSLDQDNIIANKTGFAVIKGYTPAKEFYVPQYSGTLADDQISDFRSTLYWNPRVILDKDHRKINLSFYNNDLSNKFRVVIEGMTHDGKLTRIEQIIK